VVALVFAVVVLATGCRVDATTSVVVADDGSGTVTVEVVLDAEAAARIPDLAEQLRVEDLAETGWTVTDPEPAEGGGVTITATKPFADPDQMTAVLAEVGARRGPVTASSLTRERAFGRTTYDFAATLSLAQGIRTFSDGPLTELLDGFPVGRDLDSLEAELGVPIEDTMGYRLEVTLPDGDTTATSTWDLAMGDGPVEAAASTEEVNRLALGLAAASVAAVVLLLVVLLVRLVRRRRRTGPGRRVSG